MTTGQPDTPSGQLIPGVRYRRRRLDIPQQVTRNGETRTVTVTQDVHVPVPPRDWDHIVLTAVTCTAGLMLLASVIWSTASAGDLLARAVVPPVAYTAAVVFDIAWVSCLALEWLARYDDERVKAPRRAGHVALLVAMLVVCAHGWLADSWVVGLASAAISALAKATWSRVMRYQARTLDPETKAWLAARESEISADLILASRLRQQARLRGQHAALLAATAPQVEVDPGPDSPDANPDGPDPSGRASGTVRSAVRAAADVLPNPTPQAVAAHLSAVGVDVDEDTVSALLDATEQPRLRPVGGSVKDSVRTAVASGVTDPALVLDYVRQIHGQGVRPDTVDRYLRATKEPA